MRMKDQEPSREKKYKAYWNKKDGSVQRYLVITGFGKGQGRLPKQRGIGITRRTSSRRLPASTLVQHIINPQRAA